MGNLFDSFLRSWNRSWYFYLLFFSIAIFIIYFIFYLNCGYGWDESVYLMHTDIFLGRLSDFNELAFRPIILSLVIVPFYLISNNIFFLHCTMLLFFCFSMLILFLLFKKIFSLEVASIISALFFISPLVFYTAQFVLTDLFVFIFIIPGIYFSYLFYESKKNKFIVFASLFFALAFLTRFFCGSFILVILLTIILHFKFDWESVKITCYRLILFFISFLIFVSPYFIFVKLKFGSILHTFVSGKLLVSAYNVPWHNYLVYLAGLWPAFLFLFICGLYFLYKSGIFTNFKKFNNSSIEKFICIFILLFVFQFIYLSITPHKEPRYTIPLALTLSFICGYGLYQLLIYLKTVLKNKIILLKKCFHVFFCIMLIGLMVVFVFYIIHPVNRLNLDMEPINYLKNYDFNGKLYVNSDVPQYFYLFDKEVVNIYYYYINNLDYVSQFDESGIFVYNTNSQMDLNNLAVELIPIKELFPYVIYEVNLK